ncbi:hypothetical protein LO772_21770 [Yinghuangia sp. ASG 101]|uniref:hypothetical protein n=1 Tax=Yinghuangia sp. ASG 101 TaxID=2896848 RepID=UPI001E3BC0CD|nr:hypothetical protein [Yinghuangia sp. ASG 101]UGQ09553.1 hypothetical protein LO772_21770 [Yinghuangia sp. ASG 101]
MDFHDTCRGSLCVLPAHSIFRSHDTGLAAEKSAAKLEEPKEKARKVDSEGAAESRKHTGNSVLGWKHRKTKEIPKNATPGETGDRVSMEASVP